MRYHFTPVRMAIIKSLQATNVGKEEEKKEPLYSAGGSVNCCCHYEKQYRVSSKL